MAQPGRGRAPRRLRGRRDPGSGRRRAGRLRRSTVSSRPAATTMRSSSPATSAREGRAAPVGAWRGCDRLRTTALALVRPADLAVGGASTTCCSATSPARAHRRRAGTSQGSGGRVAVPEPLARAHDLAPGDELRVRGTQEQVGALVNQPDGGAAPVPAGPRITLRVVGSAARRLTSACRARSVGVLLLQRAFVVAHGEQIGDFSGPTGGVLFVRLTDGGRASQFLDEARSRRGRTDRRCRPCSPDRGWRAGLGRPARDRRVRVRCGRGHCRSDRARARSDGRSHCSPPGRRRCAISGWHGRCTVGADGAGPGRGRRRGRRRDRRRVGSFPAHAVRGRGNADPIRGCTSTRSCSSAAN